MTKLSPWTFFVLLLSLVAFSAFANAQAADQTTPAAAQTVTGCLQKGVEPAGGFYLITAKDKHLELYNDGNASLGDHVGQTVTVTGRHSHALGGAREGEPALREAGDRREKTRRLPSDELNGGQPDLH